MITRYNSQSQNIKTLTMENCLQDNRLTMNPSIDFGFENVQVQKYWQME